MYFKSKFESKHCCVPGTKRSCFTEPDVLVKLTVRRLHIRDNLLSLMGGCSFAYPAVLLRSHPNPPYGFTPTRSLQSEVGIHREAIILSHAFPHSHCRTFHQYAYELQKDKDRENTKYHLWIWNFSSPTSEYDVPTQLSKGGTQESIAEPDTMLPKNHADLELKTPLKAVDPMDVVSLRKG
ncbi:hypothetical protein EDC04DRAFT_2616342 [Pisolithus marmoratus]|nr:hypothetical protein EDC04DRAFT_2616342 [Pisolithus marmoratus]